MLVLFDFYILDRKRSELIDTFSETHELKTYSISEIRNLLERAGLKVEGFFKDSESSENGVPNADQSSFRVLAVGSNP